MSKSFLQSNAWARFKEIQGWQVHRLAGFLGLERKLPLGVTLLYLPEISLQATHFNITSGKFNKFKRFVTEITRAAKKENMTFARIEFFIEFDEADAKALARANRFLVSAGLQKSPEEMQPEYRQLIDLTQSEEELLAQMKPKGRYNIKVAERHGVQIKNAKIKTFYDLYNESSERDGFTPRPVGYFKEMLTHMSGHVSCYIASWKGKPLAAALIVLWQGRVSYLYGGSSSAHRNVMAPYLLHWKIIQDAKGAGFKTYDLLAIAPGGVEHHKFSGLRRFKEQFGGQPVRVLGSYDLVFEPLRYRLFVAVEKMRGRF